MIHLVGRAETLRPDSGRTAARPRLVRLWRWLWQTRAFRRRDGDFDRLSEHLRRDAGLEASSVDERLRQVELMRRHYHANW